MNMFLQPENAVDLRFTVWSDTCTLLYKISETEAALYAKMEAFTRKGKKEAEILRIGPPEIAWFRILVGGQEKLKITQNLLSKSASVTLLGQPWSIRGELSTRNFDIVDNNGEVLLSHAPLWKNARICYAVSVPPTWQGLTCLCAAIIIDSTLPPENSRAVPARG